MRFDVSAWAVKELRALGLARQRLSRAATLSTELESIRRWRSFFNAGSALRRTAMPFSTRTLGSSGAATRAAVTLAVSDTGVVPKGKSVMRVAAFLRGNLGAENSLTDEVPPISCGNHRRVKQRHAADRQLQRAEARAREYP